MGFSVTGSHVIFFVAAVIAASTVSGVFIAVTMDISTSLSDRGDRISEQLDTDFQIINDPDNIPLSGSYRLFYLKNIGGNKLVTTNETFQIFVDGDIVVVANYYFSDTSIKTGEVVTLYIATSEILSGDHTLRTVGPQAVDDEFMFTI